VLNKCFRDVTIHEAAFIKQKMIKVKQIQIVSRNLEKHFQNCHNVCVMKLKLNYIHFCGTFLWIHLCGILLLLRTNVHGGQYG
jgi:hypothetical protein